MSVQGPSAVNSSRLWYYLDYIHPHHLQTIIKIVLDKFWRGSPQDDWSKAIKLIDKDIIDYVDIDDLKLPNNEPPALYQSPAYNVEIPSDILESIQDKKALKSLLGNFSNIDELITFCKKDKSFRDSVIYNAHYKDAPLYKLVHDFYVKGYGEEPSRIHFAPEKVEVVNEDNAIWMKCSYKGYIRTQKNESVHFDAECKYDLFHPENATRNLFISYPERT